MPSGKDLLKQADHVAAAGKVDPESELGSVLASYDREKRVGTERAQVAHARVIVRRAGRLGIATKPTKATSSSRTSGS